MFVVGLTMSDIGEHTFHVIDASDKDIILLGREDVEIIDSALSTNYVWHDNGSYPGIYHKALLSMKGLHDELYDGNAEAVKQLIQSVEAMELTRP